MAFPQSPGVVVKEDEILPYIPGVATAIGAFAGVFRWGPVGERLLLDSEKNLVKRLGPPTNFNAETFFTIANFLSYSSAAQTVRAANTEGSSPLVSANIVAGNTSVNVGNTSTLANGMIILAASNPNSIRVGTSINIVNSSHISLTASSDALISNSAVTIQLVNSSTAMNAVGNTAAVANLVAQGVSTEDEFNNKDENGNFDSDVVFLAKWPGAIGNSLKVSMIETSNAFFSNTELTSNGTYTANVAFVVDSNSAIISVGSNGEDPLDANALNTFINSISNSLIVGDLLVAGNSSIGEQLITIKNIAAPTQITLGSNNGTSANVLSGSQTVSTTGDAFEDLEVGQQIVFFSNSSVWQTYLVANVDSTNSITIGTTAAFTNATSTWTTLNSEVVTIDISLEDKYKRSTSTSETNLKRYWQYAETFDQAPAQSPFVLYNGNTAANDEVHLVVVDEDGKFSGVPGTILEKFSGVSRATNAKTLDGEDNYYKSVINLTSEYIWLVNDRSGAASANAENVASSTNLNPLSISLDLGTDGSDENDVSIGVLTDAYDLFASTDDVDISLIMTGKSKGGTHGAQLANYLIDNIAEFRQDAVVFVSPEKSDVINNSGSEATDIVAFRNTLRSSSYGFLDSGYKYMYDRYNDVYRYVPLNGDIAGLAAQTEQTNDAWWSFAGLNRGKIKNIVRLAYNPRKADRDLLYPNSINPVVTFPGDGTILYGDRTLLAKPSAFDRINVRRLFIVLEKAISKAAKYSLFEFNDAFTRAQFRNVVVPYLRTVKGRRGINEFLVVCDGTNNTPDVINRNEFVGDIYIKPNKSINFITLNFHATPEGITFSEAIAR